MRYEDERHWNTERRIKRWIKNQYTSKDTAAALRLEKAKKGRSKEADSAKQQQLTAAQRDDANEQLFQAIEENKRKAISYEEYTKSKQ